MSLLHDRARANDSPVGSFRTFSRWFLPLRTRDQRRSSLCTIRFEAEECDVITNGSLPRWDGSGFQEDVYNYKLYLKDCVNGWQLVRVNGNSINHVSIIR